MRCSDFHTAAAHSGVTSSLGLGTRCRIRDPMPHAMLWTVSEMARSAGPVHGDSGTVVEPRIGRVTALLFDLLGYDGRLTSEPLFSVCIPRAIEVATAAHYVPLSSDSNTMIGSFRIALDLEKPASPKTRGTGGLAFGVCRSAGSFLQVLRSHGNPRRPSRLYKLTIIARCIRIKTNASIPERPPRVGIRAFRARAFFSIGPR